MKSKLWKLIALLVTTVLLVSCAGPDSDVGTETEEVVKTEEAVMTEEVVKTEEPPEEVTLRVFTRWSDASPLSQAFRDRLAEFQSLNPHITILDESINDEKGFLDKWTTSVAADDLPDIFQNYGGVNTYDWIKAGLFLDLTEALDADSDWKDGFLNFFWNWQYEDIPGTYAVPYEFYAIPLFYNKDHLAQVGADVPETISELEEVSEKLLAAGLIPLVVGEKDDFKGDHMLVVLMLKRFGVDAFKDVAAGKLKWDGPEVLGVLSMMEDWNKKGYLGENIVGVDYATETALFLAGDAAMKYDGSWVLSEMDASDISDKIGVAPFPYFDEVPEFKDVYAGGPGAGLSISGKITGAQKDAAIKLLKFLTSVEHFTYLQETTGGGVFPVIMEPSEVIGPVTAEYIAVLGTAKEFDTGGPHLLPEVSTQFRQSIQGMFAGLSAEEAAKQIADKQAELTE